MSQIKVFKITHTRGHFVPRVEIERFLADFGRYGFRYCTLLHKEPLHLCIRLLQVLYCTAWGATPLVYLATAGTVLYEELLHLCIWLLQVLYCMRSYSTCVMGYCLACSGMFKRLPILVIYLKPTLIQSLRILAYLGQGLKDYNGIYNGTNLWKHKFRILGTKTQSYELIFHPHIEEDQT